MDEIPEEIKPKIADIDGETRDQFEVLCRHLKKLDPLMVAFSGGVDSTLLAWTAHQLLGDRFLAITACSETYPTEELREAEEIAETYGFQHRVIETSELEIEGYAENNPDRCYLCRDGLFSTLKEWLDSTEYEHIAYGENASDGAGMDYRPGQAAAREHDINRPLAAAGLVKEDIRTLSRAVGLPNWDKPELACLSSRFPYGHEITEEKLDQVHEAEAVLRSHDFRQVRVRHHGDLARIEVLPDEIERLTSEPLRTQIAEELEEIGYLYISVDLHGYRTGSLNEALS